MGAVPYIRMNMFWRALLDTLFPSYCLSCDVPLETNGAGLCDACRSRIPRFGRRELQCHADAPYDRIAATTYTCPEAQVLIKALKYEGVKRAAAECALIAAAVITEPINADVIIPVPLHPGRERKRGFNQSEWFAEALVHHHAFHNLPIARALARVKPTETQTKKPDYAARYANVVGCFAVTKPDEVNGKRVLLVDDVMTSGATLAEAARTLKRAGATRVTALVFAKA